MQKIERGFLRFPTPRKTIAKIYNARDVPGGPVGSTLGRSEPKNPIESFVLSSVLFALPAGWQKGRARGEIDNGENICHNRSPLKAPNALVGERRVSLNSLEP